VSDSDSDENNNSFNLQGNADLSYEGHNRINASVRDSQDVHLLKNDST
jgi:hypothetical protein